MMIDIRVDDLAAEATRTLIARHLDGMHDSSPPESVHALDADGLRHPAITFWSAWIDGELAGIGALKEIDAERGERLLEAIRQLTLPYRQVMTLILEDLSYEEIAETLGITIDNVGVRVNRAKKQLKERLHHD